MNKTGMLAGLVLLVVGASAQATLLGRVPLTPGGIDYQAYYDTELNITWLADANLAKTSGYLRGVKFYGEMGYMSWDDAQTWIGLLNDSSYLGTDNWRLPFIVDTGSPGCDAYVSGTECGFNPPTKSGLTVYSEMAHLYYVTLDNLYEAGYGNGPQNKGPFLNIANDFYWSGTPFVSGRLADTGYDYPKDAWGFDFGGGLQGPPWVAYDDGPYRGYTWPVRDGDISAVPVPAAGWLFASALGVMGMARRKARVPS